MSQSQSILVVGVGELGLAVIEALVNHPRRQGSITVLLRESSINTQDAAKKQQNEYLQSMGVSLVAGDTAQNSVPELAAIFKGYDVVIVCSGFGQPSGTQLKITNAVLSAGVRRYVPWQFGLDYDVIGQGSDQDLFDEQLEIRRLLRSQTTMDWVIASIGLFMSFLFLPDFGVVDLERSTVRCLGSWNTAVTLTTAKDIGTMTAEVVWYPQDISRQVVHVAGDTVTYDRVADLVEKRFSSDGSAPFKREVLDLATLKHRLSEQPDNGMLKYQNVFAEGRGLAWDKTKSLNVKRGIALEDLESYLQRMKA